MKIRVHDSFCSLPFFAQVHDKPKKLALAILHPATSIAHNKFRSDMIAPFGIILDKLSFPTLPGTNVTLLINASTKLRVESNDRSMESVALSLFRFIAAIGLEGPPAHDKPGDLEKPSDEGLMDYLINKHPAALHIPNWDMNRIEFEIKINELALGNYSLNFSINYHSRRGSQCGTNILTVNNISREELETITGLEFVQV